MVIIMTEEKTLEEKQKWESYKKAIAEQIKKKSDEAKNKKEENNNSD